MKKILVISVILNFCFFALAGYLIFKRGGKAYLNELFASEENNIDKSQLLVEQHQNTENNQNWEEIQSLYEVMPKDTNEIIFVGNSITYGCDWAELFSNPKIKNRGITGDNTIGVLKRLTEITAGKPAKIFINLGTNDLRLNMRTYEIVKNYREILTKIAIQTPETKIYIESVLPTNNNPQRNNDSIRSLNKQLKTLANEKSIKYINLHASFVNSEGKLNMDYSLDGLHLTGKGYLIWKELIESDVNE